MITKHVLARGTAALLLGAALAGNLAGTPQARAQRAADTAAEVDGPNILVNGGFEHGADPGKLLTLTAGANPLLPGWTVVIPGGDPRNVDYVGTYWQAEEGTRSLGLGFGLQPPTTDTAKLNGVKQTFSTTPDQRYRVVFYQAGGPDWGKTPQMLRLVVAGQTRDYTFQADSQATDQHMEWVKRTFVFTATGPSTSIGLYMLYGHGVEGLDNVQVRAIQTPTAGKSASPGNAAPQPGAVTLQIAAPSLAAGGQQTIQAATVKGASVALVVDYPDGSQLVVPGHAGADGHYAYSWAIPGSVHGTVKVWLDAGGRIAQATFTVS